MNLLLTFVLSAVTVAPDTVSVAVAAEVPELEPEDALALLQAEHPSRFRYSW